MSNAPVRNESHEHKAIALPGILGLLCAFGLPFLFGKLGISFFPFANHDAIVGLTDPNEGKSAILGIFFFVLAFFSFTSFMGTIFTLQPNEAVVLTFLGKYIGTIRGDGWWCNLPFAKRRKMSLRVRNFQSERLKVNDERGNPIEIAAVVSWRVVDTAKASFDVEGYEAFIVFQAESALRSIASRYPYDANNEEGESVWSLREHGDEVGEALAVELRERLEIAGIGIVDARLSHLAYAPEIAQVMLRRQQAEAVIAARRKIVEGAVSMVKQALDQLRDQGVVEFNDERKAAMVNNLLVALVSESEVTPVIQAGR